MKKSAAIVKFFILFSLLGVLSSHAHAKKVLPPLPTRGKIVAINLSDMTVTGQLAAKSEPLKFKFNNATTIEINGDRATFDKIKPGLYIRNIRLSGDNMPIVEDLDLTVK